MVEVTVVRVSAQDSWILREREIQREESRTVALYFLYVFACSRVFMFFGPVAL